MSMAGGRPGAVRGDLVRIFDGDSVAGLGDGELLGRFADSGDEAAFEALVGRLGPMVLGVCRRMLADPHDVDDAFQATFLVLVKKARSIGDRELVGPWLHGVATRTARRARSAAARRAARERLAVVPEAREVDAGLASHWPELRALIDEEIGRLPEHHRRPVVLCDVEGLSREEAARRLGWTLNMVRGRLERARDRLRGRLARRGLTPSGAWMVLMVNPPTPPPALVAATGRAAIGFAAGRIGEGLAPASAVALSRGVLKMMLLSKWKVGLAVALSAGFVAAGSGMIAAQKPGAPASPPAKVADGAQDARPGGDELAKLGQRRIEMARKHLNTSNNYYEQGRSTLDPVFQASQMLMDAEVDVATTPAERKAAIRSHLDRVRGIETLEKARVESGRATQADVEKLQTRGLDLEYHLAREEAGASPGKMPADHPPAAAVAAEPPAVARLNQERVAIARRILEDATRLSAAGRISSGELLDASTALNRAERDAAGTREERQAAIRALVDNLRKAVAIREEQARRNVAPQGDVDRARLSLLEAEIELARESAGTGPASAADLERRVAEVERKIDRVLDLLNAPRR